MNGWRSSFLKDFDFKRYDSFRQIFASALGQDERNIVINDQCPDTPFRYQANSFTVVDQNKRSIEPFYQFFFKGLDAFKEGDLLKSARLLKKAVDKGPFLINFTGVHSLGGRLGDILIPPISDVIYEIYATYYDGEEKLNYIDNIIQTEAKDYGMALGLLSYLKSAQGYTKKSGQLLKRAVLFVTEEDIREYPLGQFLSDSALEQFYGFLNRNNKILNSVKRLKPSVLIEGYKGFNIFWHAGYYFALPHNEGRFSLAKFKRKQYRYSFSGKTKHEIRERIDALRGSSVLVKRLTEDVPELDLEYKGYRIIKVGDTYFCFSQLGGRYEDLEEEALFKAVSLLEVKLMIDILQDMFERIEF